MKRILAILFICINFCLHANIELRKLVTESYTSEVKAKTLLEKTDAFNASSASNNLGYKAMACFLQCNYVSNPFSKLKQFNEGKKWLELAIGKDPKNAELIYYRYCTQVKTPSILNYKSNLATDKQLLFNYLNANQKNTNADKELIGLIKNILKENTNLTPQEKTLLI